jgi:hypothetical protein
MKSLQLARAPIAKTGMLIRKPVAGVIHFNDCPLDEGPIGSPVALVALSGSVQEKPKAISGGASHPAKTSLLRHVGLFLPLGLTGG